MNWFSDRLKERSSHAALAATVYMLADIASQSAAWAPGSLVLWLGLMKPFAACVVLFFLPDAPAPLMPPPAPLMPPPTPPEEGSP